MKKKKNFHKREYVTKMFRNINSKLTIEEKEFIKFIAEESKSIFFKNIKLQNDWEAIKNYCLNEQMSEEYDEYNSYVEFSNNVYEKIFRKMKELELNDDDIKIILTKEQYETNCWRKEA